ncbi:hypothetical protein SAMD00024442_65_1 [Candidatus Symbiothrix dinenymphae]|nr:hypothetical protein SAMD00024442_65_1 [Candidatus Symbiothrix dinenymphae]
MKKCFLSLLLVAVCGVSVSAQKGEMAVGLNFGLGTSEMHGIAVGAKFNYGVTDHFRVSPSFNYFLGNSIFSAWEVNADFHYLFNATEKFAIYPLAGISYAGWDQTIPSISVGGYTAGGGSASTGVFGVNLGAGADFSLTDAIAIGLEARYNVAFITGGSQFVPAIHLLYKF